MVAAHQVLLALTTLALAATAIRLASRLVPSGLERLVAAIVLGATAAGLEALLLGIARLGTSPVALALTTLALWLASLRLPRPETPLAEELAAWWRATPLAARVALGAAAGAWLAWTAWLLRYPALGIDSVAYHLPEVVGWIHDGSPGAVEPIVPGLPVGNYPLTNEVLIAWGSGISRSYVVAGIWAPLMTLVLAVAGWAGLRRFAVPTPAAGLAVAAICASPVLTHYQMNGASTDLPALAWLVSAWAMLAASREHPLLLAPVVLAAGLAGGTKTTVLPLALAAVAAGLWIHRARLRRLARPLGLAAAAALAVGGYWYLRNLVDHGSPFWPFVDTPWSDAPPGGKLNTGLDASFLDRPRLTLDRVGDDWLDLFAGGLLMVAGALAAPLLARSRAVLVAAGVTAASLLLWMSAPFTGFSVRGFEVATISTIRYLLPAAAAAAFTLGLASAARGPARLYGIGVLAAAAVLGVLQTRDLGFPSVPGAATPLAGAAIGAVLVLAADRLALRAPALSPGVRAAATVVLAAAAGALLATAASGFVRRHSTTAKLFGTDVVRWFVDQPAFSGDGRVVAGAPVTWGPLAGDRLQHRFAWVPTAEPCPRVRARLRQGWVLVLRSPANNATPSRSARCLARERPRFAGVGFTVYGG